MHTMPMATSFMENPFSQAGREAIQGYLNGGEANIRRFRGQVRARKVRCGIIDPAYRWSIRPIYPNIGVWRETAVRPRSAGLRSGGKTTYRTTPSGFRLDTV